MQKDILIKDFWYHLPQEKIALYPLPDREKSKLLVYKNGTIEHSRFEALASFLPANSTLFFNNTKVIPARIFFQKETGAVIELFLLNPVSPSTVVQQAMEARQSNRWACTIGNLKRWSPGTTLTRSFHEINITATIVDREKGVVEFKWTPEELSFAEIISKIGITPLPPYIKRPAEDYDRQRYQTIYSDPEGAVAAPTAGLHFTDKIINQLKILNHNIEFLTLHVSAGTFQPMKVENVMHHAMHSEQVIVTVNILEKLLSSRFTIAVGTTSMRTLESLYWYGVKLIGNPEEEFIIHQFDPYQLPSQFSVDVTLKAILTRMKKEKLESITGETSIMIMPGYPFKITNGLITNFHQPGSTLMLLVAAFIGPAWKHIYEVAIQNNYRFLSYGDSSLLVPNHTK